MVDAVDRGRAQRIADGDREQYGGGFARGVPAIERVAGHGGSGTHPDRTADSVAEGFSFGNFPDRDRARAPDRDPEFAPDDHRSMGRLPDLPQSSAKGLYRWA